MLRTLLRWLSRADRTCLEIHVPIAPQERFFTMAHYLLASLRLHGGSLSETRMIVTMGADEPPYDVARRLPWTRNYNVEFCWLERAIFRKYSIYATALERFRYEFKAPLVLHMDADMIFTGSIEDIVAQVGREQVFAGVLARVSPFVDMPDPSSELWWGQLCEQAALWPPQLTCEHPGWGVTYHHPEARYCIPYFNLGFLLAPAQIMRRIGDVVYKEMEYCDRVLQTQFRCQVAVALALQRLGIKSLLLPLRYNFSNNFGLAGPFAEELAQIRVFHYMRPDEIDKQRDFANVASVDALIHKKQVTGINRQFVEALRPIHERVCQDLGWTARRAA